MRNNINQQEQTLLFETDSQSRNALANTAVNSKTGNANNYSSNSFSLQKVRTPRSSRNMTSRDEMNLAEFPLAVLSTRIDNRIKTLEFTDYTKGPNNEMVERRWIITGADKFGLPTSTDDDVVLGLIRLSMEGGFKDPKVYFTRYELLKALRWSTEGRSYQRLIKSLDRLSGVRVRSSNSFYDNSTKSYQTSNFGIIDAYEINDERASGSNEKASFFIWSEMLFHSFKSGYIKKLDLDLYFSLKSAIARRLYRYLDKHFYFKGTIDAHLMTLAFEKIGLSRSYRYVSSIKQQLRPALDELVLIGFLSKFEFIGDSEATVLRCYSNSESVSSSYLQSSAIKSSPVKNDNFVNSEESKGHAFIDHVEKVAQNSQDKTTPRFDRSQLNALTKDQADLVEALYERGLGLKQSKTLVLNQETAIYGRLKSIIKYFDYLVTSADKKISRNPAGFLYRAFEFPLKINLPREFAEMSANEKKSLRPEHKVVKARRASTKNTMSSTDGVYETQISSQEHIQGRKEYNEYIQNELNCAMTRMAPSELGELFAETEAKMKSLKRILGNDKFQEAIEGCVRDELRRRFRLPQFQDWLARATS